MNAASTIAPRTDLLFDSMLLLTGAIALAICVTIVFFALRYRQGRQVERGLVQRKLGLELGWTLIPLGLFIGVFVWAAHDFVGLYHPPDDALPVYVVAKQWMWKLQHRNGKREINELQVPLGQPVRLIMTSQDVIHSFYVPAFRLKQDVLPGRYTYLSFTDDKPGVYHQLSAAQ